MLTASTAIVSFVLAPLSEASTWAALLFGFPLLFAARTPRAWPVGTALAGLAAGIRPNQAPGLAVLVAVFLMTVPRRRWRSALAASTVFLAVAALPLAHNLYYGGRFVLFATAGAHPASLTLPPGQLLALGHDAAVRSQAVAKVRQLLYLEPLPDPALRLAMHGLQAAWLLAVAGTIASWRRVDGLTWLLLLGPQRSSASTSSTPPCTTTPATLWPAIWRWGSWRPTWPVGAGARAPRWARRARDLATEMTPARAGHSNRTPARTMPTPRAAQVA